MEARPFEVVESRAGDRIVLAVRGEIDLATAPMLVAALQGATDAASGDVWVDLAEVEFMDSTGLSALVGAHRALERSPRQLVVICPDGLPRRAIEISGLDSFIRVCRDATEAGAA